MPDFIDQLSAALCTEPKDEPRRDRRISDLPAVTFESETVLFGNDSVVAIDGVDYTIADHYATTAVRNWSHRDDPGLRGEMGPMGPPGRDADMSRVAALERALAAHERQITAIRQLLLNERVIDAMREDLRAEMHEWDARVIGDIRDALPVRLAPQQTLLNQQTLQDVQRWGRDEIDETTWREITETTDDHGTWGRFLSDHGLPRLERQDPEAVHTGPPTG
jgi:hypothetical protein